MSRKKRKGQSIIELAVGLIALIPIVLVVFDLAVIVIAVQMNDSTCREAARVAASGDPTEEQLRAQAVIARANAKMGGMLSNFRLAPGSPTDTLQPNAAAAVKALGDFGGALNGSVTVETLVDVKPFVVQVVYNGKSPLIFKSRQTFPITYVVPNQAK